MILAHEAEMRAGSGFERFYQIRVFFGKKPDRVGLGVSVGRHRLHVTVQALKAEHAGMDGIDLVPELAGRGFSCFSQADHMSSPSGLGLRRSGKDGLLRRVHDQNEERINQFLLLLRQEKAPAGLNDEPIALIRPAISKLR